MIKPNVMAVKERPNFLAMLAFKSFLFCFDFFYPFSKGITKYTKNKKEQNIELILKKWYDIHDKDKGYL